MFDDIFAEAAGDTVSSISGKDRRGLTYSVKPAGAVVGDILDEDNWKEAAESGGSISEKGKTATGKTVSRSLSDATAKQTRKALDKLFAESVDESKGKKDKKRSGKPDTVTPEPSANGHA